MKTRGLTFLSLAICIVHIIPFYILITSSFKKADDYSSSWSVPGYVFLDNFTNAWEHANLGRVFFNNIVITALAVILLVLLGSIASYPLARYPTKFNKKIYVIFVSALIVPPLSILVPLYNIMVDMGGMNTFWGVILLHVTFQLPITIFFYTGFISTIPRELDEAAMLDGAGRAELFFRIIMPLLKPVTSSSIIITGVWIWNDYQFSVFFLQSSKVHNITVALSQFFAQYNSNIGWVAAGALLGMLPMVAVFLFLQKYFIQGLSSGAVKG
ncbi:carbohydrate ABC transporter permease [Cohnella hongkongensis]|uniref:Carbohydrate ABC transporter permease n=1 Tax=Cohnella hongkongensis TaxID=178337 RepID=A0ABV9FEM9_9BACL